MRGMATIDAKTPAISMRTERRRCRVFKTMRRYRSDPLAELLNIKLEDFYFITRFFQCRDQLVQTVN